VERLEGLRIADFSQLVQGPNTTEMLADMGADVIKIEPLHGDWQRDWSLRDADINGESVSFLTFSWGKRSIALNLKTRCAQRPHSKSSIPAMCCSRILDRALWIA
jgi:crotonobetainyl-CoA:carnitine CoA-transferase CaiB-like acyl-CoA transferase